MRRVYIKLGVSFFLLGNSCVDDKITSQLDIHTQTQLKANKELLESVFTNQYQDISWDQAKTLLLERNIGYRNSQSSIKEAKKQKKDQWRQIIPRLFVAASVNSALGELANITSDDINLSIIYGLNIPDPLNYYAQAYSFAIQEIQTEITHQIMERQLQVTLYQTFLLHDELRMSEKELKLFKTKIERAPASQLANTLRNLRSKELQLQNRKERLRVRTNQLFNTPGKNWNLVGKLPSLDYSKKLDRIDFYKGYGKLGLKLQTIEIELNILQVWQVKVRRWPSLSIGASPPPLYGTDSIQNFNFNAADFGLFTGVNKSFELDDIFDKESLRNAEYRAKVNRESLLNRMETEVSQLELNKFTYRELLKKKAASERIMKLKKSQIRQGSDRSILNDLSALKKLELSLLATNNQLKQLDLQFWIWDDTSL
jgi:hypothetical protein